MKRPLTLLALGLSCVAAVQASDFPTQARVEYVIGCMNSNGGQTYDNLYSCVCRVDELAKHFSYAEYAEAETFAQLRSTAGERGGLFRDPPRAGELREKLAAAQREAETACLHKGS